MVLRHKNAINGTFVTQNLPRQARNVQIGILMFLLFAAIWGLLKFRKKLLFGS